MLNPLSGQRGPVVEIVPLLQPLKYRVILGDGAVVRRTVELASGQVKTIACGEVVEVAAKQFSDLGNRCVQRLKLADGKGRGGRAKRRVVFDSIRGLCLLLVYLFGLVRVCVYVCFLRLFLCALRVFRPVRLRFCLFYFFSRSFCLPVCLCVCLSATVLYQCSACRTTPVAPPLQSTAPHLDWILRKLMRIMKIRATYDMYPGFAALYCMHSRFCSD